MKRLAAGNWKMNGTAEDLAEATALIAAHPAPGCEMLLCPPATLLHRMAQLAAGSALMVGGQDCHAKASGAHTGDTSAAQLKDAGATHVIVGHSERRTDHRETDAMVQAKATAAIGAGLVAIVCLGETLGERQAGQTLAVVGAQLDGSLPAGGSPAALVIAYEPVWAIGTGLTPTTAEIAEVHAFLRARLVERFGAAGRGVRLLYGGSVKASNAAEIFAVPDVDGALVGGASLKAAEFGRIVAALAAA
jgi:triosephosphate isomerase